MSTSVATMRYPFALHSRRITRFMIVSALLLAIAVLLILLSTVHALPTSLEGLGILAYILGFVALAVLLLMLILSNEYRRSGIWIDADRVRVQFPGEKAQEIAWSEARFAVNEGEDYLRISKGKEGLGHVFGDTHYVRLHLEGLYPGQREQAEAAIAEHIEVRRPKHFTLMTLLNNKGEMVARGRLYLFEHDVLCAENRGEKRVFFYAPLRKLTSVKQRDSFYVGKLECESFSIRYKDKDYVIMLGYETTIAGNIGSSSHWSVTGYAQEWVEALSAG
jgi:hypothetical protein